MKHDEKALANTFAVFVAIIYLACGLIVAVAPNFMKLVTRSWVHGIELAESWSGRAFPGNFLLGLVTAVVGAWISGWIFARLYNFFLKK